MTRTLLLTLSLLLGAGCRVGVENHKFELPKRYRIPTGQAAKDVGRWWTMFGDGNLERLIQLAFSESLSVEQARQRVEQARQGVIAGRAVWFPSVSGSATVGRSKNILRFSLPNAAGVRVPTTISNTNNNASLSATASWELDFGAMYYGYKAAKHSHAAAYEQLRAAYISLVAELVDTYYRTVAARAQMKLRDQAIKNRQAQLELVERRYRVGVVTAFDLYQAKQSLSTAKAEREQYFAAAKVNENALAVLCGRFPGQIDPGAIDVLPKTVRELPAVAPQKLLYTRPDLRAAHRQLLAADMQVGQAFAAHFPKLSLSFTPGYQFAPGSGFIYNVAGGLLAPIFNGGRIHAQYKQARAKVLEQIAAFKSLLRVAVQEITVAIGQGRAYERQLRHLEDAAKSAEGALRLSTDQYSQGLLTYINVLTAEQAVTTARSGLIASRQGLIAARISLARALGGTWVDGVIDEQEKKRREKERKRKRETKTATAVAKR